VTSRTSTLSLAALGIVMLAGASEAAAADSHPIDPAHPWARRLDDELSKPLVEQWYGAETAARLRQRGARWNGTMLLDGDTLDEESLEQLGIPPIPAEAYTASPGVLYLNFDGVTLTPDCPSEDLANSALNCSPLVASETTFAAWGDAGQRASITQQMQQYTEAYNIIITTNRPPDFLPYTMAVVGGTAGQAGLEGACGVANVQCDGLRRNHVSLNFAQSCPGGVADIIGQETSHNWGLEHTDNPTDLLYPTVTGGFKEYVDSCMSIVSNNGNPVQCGYVHDEYCGSGEQQNSHAEMLGVFGPRVPDTGQPQIVSTYPEHGAQLSSSESFIVTAELADDSTFLGVKWTWVEGLPEGTESFTRCTNNVCDQAFDPGPSFDPSEVAWDFVQFSAPIPLGTYTFTLEAIDTYGNSVTRTFTFEVVEGEGDGGSADGTGDGGGVDETGGSGGGSSPDGDGDGDGDDGGTAGDGTGSVGLDGGGDDGGGTCRVGRPAPLGLGLLALGLLGLARRRR
jgi:MYXO-CTERM domain-containing protein